MRLAGIVLALLLTALPATASAEPRQPELVTVRLGSGDVTDELNQQIEQAPDGTADQPTLLQLPGGSHRVDGTVEVEDQEHMILDGDGAVLATDDPGDKTRQHLAIHESRDVAVRNLTIDGPNDAYTPDRSVVSEFQAGVQVRDSEGVRVHHTTVRDVHGDGFMIAPGKRHEPGTWSRRVRVWKVVVDGAGRQGVFIGGGEDVRVTDSRFGRIGRNAFSMEPAFPGDGYEDVTFRDNQVGLVGSRMAAVAGHEGTTGQDVRIVGNTAVATHMRIVIWGDSRKRDVAIIGNRSLVNSRRTDPGTGVSESWVIRCQDTPGVVVEDNHQPLAAGMTFYSQSGCSR